MNGPNDVGDVKAIMADLRTGVERLLHAVENEQGGVLSLAGCPFLLTKGKKRHSRD